MQAGVTVKRYKIRCQ